MKRWIITGANGYVGGELCKQLCARGDSVFAVVRSGRTGDVPKSRGIFCYTYEDLPRIVSEGDNFVHCAGKVGYAGSWDEFVRANVDWTVSLFEQAANRGARCFVYISSIAALGYRNRAGDEVLAEESAPLLCDGELYGRSKWLTEQNLQRRAANAETRLVILRPGLVYGRRPFAQRQTWLRRGVVFDPGQRVPLVHLDNLTDAIIRIVGSAEGQGTFVVVDDEQPTLRDLNALRVHLGLLRYSPWVVGKSAFWILLGIRTLIRQIRQRANPIQAGHPLAEYYFHTRRLRYSSEKLRSLTGWVPIVDLKKGLYSCARDGQVTDSSCTEDNAHHCEHIPGGQ